MTRSVKDMTLSRKVAFEGCGGVSSVTVSGTKAEPGGKQYLYRHPARRFFSAGECE